MRIRNVIKLELIPYTKPYNYSFNSYAIKSMEKLAFDSFKIVPTGHPFD